MGKNIKDKEYPEKIKDNKMIGCNNSICEHWKYNHYEVLDGSIHCPLYEGYEMFFGYCKDFILLEEDNK